MNKNISARPGQRGDGGAGMTSRTDNAERTSWVDGLRSRLAQFDRRPRRVAAAYLAWLTLAEFVSSFGSPQLGLILHALLLLALIYHAAQDLHRPLNKLLLTLAFAPLIRLMSFSLPLANFPQASWYFIISVPLFVAAFLMKRILGYSASDIGLRRGRLIDQIPIALTGITFGAVEFAILRPEPIAASFRLADLWLPALVLLISTGFFEELLFRGLMQRASDDALAGTGRTRWLAVIYVSAIFAVLHLGYKSAVDVAFVFVVALFFGWAVSETRSLLGVTLAHGLTNIMLFIIMPLIMQVAAQIAP